MKTENVLYTDGHDVTVTSSMLQVKKKWYALSGITKHNFSILPPDRVTCFTLLVLGVLLEVIGAANLISPNTVSDMYIMDQSVTANQLSMGVGIFFLLVGAVWMFFTKERYAVSITTAEGERNVIVSDRKEYIRQIVHALNEAFFAKFDSSTSSSLTARKRDFIVSGR
jgi:ABC-type multidrug transport system fused ATPase/permease subunit